MELALESVFQGGVLFPCFGAAEVKRGQGKAKAKWEEWFTLIILVCSAGRKGHIIVGHGLFRDVMVWVHGNGKFSPAIFISKERLS